MNQPLRMVAFAPSGASAPSRYRDWNRILTNLGLDREIVIYPVDRPGADARWQEAAITSMPELVEDLITTVVPIVAGARYVLAGHSVGGLSCYELAHAVATRALPEPEALVIFGHNAPDQMAGRVSLQGVPAEQAIGFLRSLGGAPAELLDDPVAVQELLEQLLADDALSSSYTWVDRQPPLSMPIIAVCADYDPQTSEDAMRAWRAHTTGRFFFHRTPGGHFALYEPDVAAQVLRDVYLDLRDARLVGSRS